MARSAASSPSLDGRAHLMDSRMRSGSMGAPTLDIVDHNVLRNHFHVAKAAAAAATCYQNGIKPTKEDYLTAIIQDGAHKGKHCEAVDVAGGDMVKVIVRGANDGISQVLYLRIASLMPRRTFKQMLNEGKRLLRPVHKPDASSPSRAKKRARVALHGSPWLSETEDSKL